MSKFHLTLYRYFEDVAARLKHQASQAGNALTNSADVGSEREDIYRDFLVNHVPVACDVIRGGFLYGMNGEQSGQLDLLVTSDTTPRFDLRGQKNGKQFAPVDGCLAVISVKSKLNTRELEKALLEFSRIPAKATDRPKTVYRTVIHDYADWPFKVLYASDSISLGAIKKALMKFYEDNPNIPLSSRPNLIHVVGQWAIFRSTELAELYSDGKVVSEKGDWYAEQIQPDVLALATVLHRIQENAAGARYLQIDFGSMINDVLDAGHPNGPPQSKN